MAEIFLYLPFFLLNILIIIFIIWWRGLISFEGLGVSLLAIVIISDYLGLIINFFYAPITTEEILISRIYPSIIHAIGLLALCAGLFIFNSKPVSIPRMFNPDQTKVIIRIAKFLVFFGLTLKFISFYAEDITSIKSFFHHIYKYTIAQRKFGGFLDEGLNIATLGLGIIAANKKTIKQQMLFLIFMMGLTFAFSTSRGGVLSSVMVFYLLLWIFNKKLMKKWFNPAFFGLLILIIVLTAGFKSQIRGGLSQRQINTCFSELWRWGVDRFRDRFSSEGLYDGYSNFVNRISKDESRLYNGRVLKYTLTSWVPYVIYKNKPQHPFRAIGDLVYRDFRVSMEDVSAVMLVGTAFADYGIWSVILYLFFYGALLGFLRRITASSNTNILLFVWYLHFMVIDGFSNFIHGGVINISGTFALATGIITITFCYLQMISIFRTAALSVKKEKLLR